MTSESASDGRLLTSGVTSTVAAALPSFLTGALGVQVSEALDLGPVALGLAIASFGVGAATTSTLLGRRVDGLGPRPALRIGLLGAGVAALAVAVAAHDAVTLMLLLAAGGVANALVQPAVNVMLAHGIHTTRQGIAFGIKQSGLPTAGLVSGLAVPTIALTVGWRWAYVGAAALALAAFVFVPVVPSSRPARAPSRSSDAPTSILWALTAAMALGAGAAAGMTAFLVSGAVDVGVGRGTAGLLLGLGSVMSILARLAAGGWADRSGRSALGPVVTMLAVGAVAMATMGIGNPVLFVAATPVAFAAGWGWPGLFNLAVVRISRNAPGAATGLTQTGVYVGILSGPFLFGTLVEELSFTAAWVVNGGLAAAAATAMAVARATLARADLAPVAR